MSEQWPSKEQEIWFQAGVTGERERIIKLLTDHFQHRDLDGIRLDNFHNDSLDEAIELIKGETK
jgi:hypothetical protein